MMKVTYRKEGKLDIRRTLLNRLGLIGYNVLSYAKTKSVATPE